MKNTITDFSITKTWAHPFKLKLVKCFDLLYFSIPDCLMNNLIPGCLMHN